MRYKIFLTDSIETLQNEELIAEANTFEEACHTLSEALRERGYGNSPYWRFLMHSFATVIDFGNWSKFAAIVPPVPTSVITGDN